MKGDSILEQTKIDVYGAVRSHYQAKIVVTESVGSGDACCGSGAGCCSSESNSVAIGYSAEELAKIPADANLGLGCGNPLRFSDIGEGDRVLDLGSGGGIDCFIASGKVGRSGRVIGVDMTPEMIERARRTAKSHANYENVEFRLGEIENLPVADGSVDLVISNCVVNLSPDKARVYREVFRALAPGGRVAISDMVAIGDIPEELQRDPEAYASCISGAQSTEKSRANLLAAGFAEVEILVQGELPGEPQVAKYAASALIRARKP